MCTDIGSCLGATILSPAFMGFKGLAMISVMNYCTTGTQSLLSETKPTIYSPLLTGASDDRSIILTKLVFLYQSH